MKCLKIDNGKGLFSLDGDAWQQLDLITKDNILSIVTECLVNGFEMDNPFETSVHNKAHEIIYNNLFTKFTELDKQKSKFKDESEGLYKESLAKYNE